MSVAATDGSIPREVVVLAAAVTVAFLGGASKLFSWSVAETSDCEIDGSGVSWPGDLEFPS